MAFGDAQLNSRNPAASEAEDGPHLSLLDIVDAPQSSMQPLPTSGELLAVANDNDDPFIKLRHLVIPPMSASARERAIERALRAFDLAKQIKGLQPANDN